MDTSVLYHANCPDGIAAAFACWQRFGETAEYIPVSYGQPMPPIPCEHTTYIVDFSYPKAVLETFLAARIHYRRGTHPQVIVLDHHASAERELLPLTAMGLPGMMICFDMRESGASLTWKYLQTGEWDPRNDPEVEGLEHSMPTFFKYVRDRDLWQWKLPDSHPISLAYWALPKDWLSIEQFAQDLDEAEGYHRIVMQGTAMARYAHALIVEQAARAFQGTIGGYDVPIVNTTTLFSEVGDYLCTTHPDILFCAYFFDRSDGKRQWGLRGHGKVDCSRVASAYGGGGHANAAGFVTAQGWVPSTTAHATRRSNIDAP
jgi:oligoribonuclease NrnB/cAMP/cGMP phosphodiesterase (DHH superfamily)